MDIFITIYQYFERGFIYIFDKWERVSKFFFVHLQISGTALLIALLIAFPLGLLITKVRWLYSPVLSVLNVFYTIPSLAFLALLVPVWGLSPITTIVVLVLYAQTILVRNIAIGFNGVDSGVIEAARGMGMSSWQVLYKVEFPLALPVILAGMRVATLTIISIATVGAWVGAETLGELLKVADNPRLNAAGVICVVFIALIADQIYRLLERITTPYRRSSKSLAVSR